MNEVLEDLLEVITLGSTSLATNRLFQVIPEDERKLLDEERSKAFRHTVAQLLFFTPRASKGINMNISFLCNQVRSPYEDDW